jgi:hypothetical protein
MNQKLRTATRAGDEAPATAPIAITVCAAALAAIAHAVVEWWGFTERALLALAGAVGVACASGALLGGFFALLVRIDRLLVDKTRTSWVGAAPYAAALPLALAVLALTPADVRRSTSGQQVLLWVVFWSLIVLGVFASRRALGIALRGARHRARGAVGASLTLGAIGALLVFVGRPSCLGRLFPRLEAALAWSAITAWTLATILLLTYAASLASRVARAVRIGACLAAGWSLVVLFTPSAVPRLERWVRTPDSARRTHAFRLASFARFIGASGARGLLAGDPARIMVDRHDLHDTTPDEIWEEGSAPASGPSSAPPQDRYNVVVFFVDALRHDVASDAAVMPRLASFASGALVFSRAYGAASDTLRSLPALLSCRYDADLLRHAPLLRAAKDRGLQTVLFIPESPYEFLHTLYPGFAFDDVQSVPDYDREKRHVWAYGAERPTARLLVDRALEWISSAPRDPFFAWIYNYDVHNWGDLDKSYVDDLGALLPGESNLPARYRAAARGVDDAFGRLVDALSERGLLERTVILVVADHGEGLGRQGFWTHTTHLWETLVRIPLILKSPGGASGRIDDPVSIVDVWSGLRRYIGAPPHPCHGEDLLALGERPRARPILFSAVTDGALARIGAVEGERKLVLPVREGDAELFDLTATDPDAASIGSLEPETFVRLRSALVRSPVFPRR